MGVLRGFFYLVPFLVLRAVLATAADPSLVLIARTSLAHDIAGALAGTQINVEGISAKPAVADVFYCGGNGSSADLLILLTSNAGPAPAHFSRSDCSRDVPDLAKSFVALPNVVGVLRSSLSNSDGSSLHSSVISAAFASSVPASEQQALSKFSEQVPIGMIALDWNFIHEQFLVHFAFEKDDLVVGLFDAGSLPSDGWSAPKLPASDPSRFVNLRLLLSHSRVASMLGKYHDNIRFNIPDPKMVLTNIGYVGVDGILQITTDLHSFAANDDASVNVDFAGPDLKVSKVAATASQHENCSGNPIQKLICVKNNAAHDAFALTAQGILSIAFSGKYLRPTSYQKPLAFRLLNRDFTCKFAINQAASTGQYLVLSGGAIIEH